TAEVAANFRRVWTRIGTPPNSLNCLLGAFFLDLAAEGGAMRVPSPAAGIMTNTFIGAISIVQGKVFGLRPGSVQPLKGRMISKIFGIAKAMRFHHILYRTLSPHPLHFFEFDSIPDRAERGRECCRTGLHQVDLPHQGLAVVHQHASLHPLQLHRFSRQGLAYLPPAPLQFQLPMRSYPLHFAPTPVLPL